MDTLVYLSLISLNHVFNMVIHITKIPPCETCMQVRKQQLELDMKQQTGSK